MSTDALLPLADAAGRQAGVWFVLLLLALLCGTALLGRLWQRHVWPRTHDGPPGRYGYQPPETRKSPAWDRR